MATKVDVIALIDRHPVTRFQIGVLILCMLVAALDGFDTQAIGYTAPAIAAVIHLPMPQFGQVGSWGLAGAAIGALSFGPLADIFGRKSANALRASRARDILGGRSWPRKSTSLR